MTAPVSWGSASAIAWPRGPGGATGDNLTSLATGVAKGLGALDLGTTPVPDLLIPPIRIKTGASGFTSSSLFSVYFVACTDTVNGVWTDGIDPDAVTDQASKIVTAPKIAEITVGANSANYYLDWISIAGVFQMMALPRWVSLVCKLTSSGSLTGTAGDHKAQYHILNFV